MKYLRAIEPEDLDLMYVVENDPMVCRYTSTTVPVSRYALREYISGNQGDLFRDNQVRMTIVDAENGNACGFLDITDLSPVHHRAEVGIVLLPGSQGKGIATEALKEASEYAFRQGLHQLYAVCVAENTRACALFQRAGYERMADLSEWVFVDGIYSDAVLFRKRLNNIP